MSGLQLKTWHGIYIVGGAYNKYQFRPVQFSLYVISSNLIPCSFVESYYHIWIIAYSANYYHSDRAYILIVIGPFLGVLFNKYGHRSVSFVGGILFSLGLLLTSFSPSLFYLYVSHGIITGNYMDKLISMELPSDIKWTCIMVIFSGFPTIDSCIIRNYGYVRNNSGLW